MAYSCRNYYAFFRKAIYIVSSLCNGQLYVPPKSVVDKNVYFMDFFFKRWKRRKYSNFIVSILDSFKSLHALEKRNMWGTTHTHTNSFAEWSLVINCFFISNKKVKKCVSFLLPEKTLAGDVMSLLKKVVSIEYTWKLNYIKSKNCKSSRVSMIKIELSKIIPQLFLFFSWLCHDSSNWFRHSYCTWFLEGIKKYPKQPIIIDDLSTARFHNGLL